MPRTKHEFCTVPSCSRMHRARGYCQLHLNRIADGVPLDKPIQRTGPQGNNSCKEDNCSRDYYAKGHCRFHYERSRQGIPLEQEYAVKRTKTYPPCLSNFCEEPGVIKGRCKSHYSRNQKGLPDGLIRRHNAKPLTENGRVCSRCDRSRPLEEYYVRSNGSIQSVCKDCHKAAAAVRQYIRMEGRSRPDWAYDYCKKVGFNAEDNNPQA